MLAVARAARRRTVIALVAPWQLATLVGSTSVAALFVASSG